MDESKSLTEALRLIKTLQDRLYDTIDTLQAIAECKKYFGMFTDEIATGMCLRAEQTLERIKNEQKNKE